jgi:hypothetical protein
MLTKHDEYRILTQAQADWALRERGFPKHTRQRWEDGTWLARCRAIINAARKLGFEE